MMTMSPQTVGLITCYFIINVLTICILPTEIQNIHHQPSTVLVLFQKFWPFINYPRPTSKRPDAIKYFHAPLGRKTSFQRHISSEALEKINIFSSSLVSADKTALFSKPKNKFPYRNELYYLLKSGSSKSDERNQGSLLKYSNHQNSHAIVHQYNVPHYTSKDNMGFYNTAEHGEVKISQDKVSKEVRPNGYLERFSVLRNDNNEINLRSYNEKLHKLPLQSDKHYEPLKVTQEAAILERNRPVTKTAPQFIGQNGIPSKGSSSENSGVESVRLNVSSLEIFPGKLEIPIKKVNSTEAEKFGLLNSVLKKNRTCIFLRNLCVIAFDSNKGGNHSVSAYDKINKTNALKTLYPKLEEFGRQKIRSNSMAGIVTGNVFEQTHDEVESSKTAKRFFRSRPNTTTRYTQRKGRMLEQVKGDSVVDKGESLRTTLPFENGGLPLLPKVKEQNNRPQIERRNGELIPETATVTNFELHTVQSTIVPDVNNTKSASNVSEIPLGSKVSRDEVTSLTSEAVVLGILADRVGNGSRTFGFESDEQSRRGKMTEFRGTRNVPVEKSTSFFVSPHYTEDYDVRSRGVSIPEFKPGSLSNFSVTFRRQPVRQMSVSDARSTTGFTYVKPRRYVFGAKRIVVTNPASTTTSPTSTEGVRVIGSTFFPNRLQKGSLQFGRRNMDSSTTFVPTKEEVTNEPQKTSSEEADNDGGVDDEITAHELGFTMEKLAYLLIGTCCCLSIICLVAVVAAIKCRRLIIERRLRNRLFRHNLYHNSSAPWQQHLYDQFLYLNGHPTGSSSSKNSCNCRCVTWSLGARNLDTRPICPTRSSIYLTGPKSLPFGAGSSLCYETMIHTSRRDSMTSRPRPPPRVSSKSEESSNENDSLDPNSDVDTSPVHDKRCTCIHPSWAVRNDSPNSFYDMCPNRRRSGCPRGSKAGPEVGTSGLDNDCPPPVTGSDYLDGGDGVVYWSSNDERLI